MDNFNTSRWYFLLAVLHVVVDVISVAHETVYLDPRLSGPVYSLSRS